MNRIAHIIHTRGRHVMPAEDPYQRELLAEYVRRLVAGHGELRVRLDGRCWAVRTYDGPCPTCGRPYPGALSPRPGGAARALRGAGDAARPAA